MTFIQFIGGVTSAQGFKAAGIYAGIKKKNVDKKDMAIIASDNEAASAGVFTQNKYAAAPVDWSREVIKSGLTRAIVVNSGNANAVTGQAGYADACEMAVLTGEAFGVSAEKVLVCSTGVIGVRMPMDIIRAGIAEAAHSLTYDGGHDAAQAIITTDTFTKEIAVKLHINGREVVIGGMAKGSGMIHPNMATMLCFITTDAAIEPSLLAQLTKAAADKSFNMITVDGDTSTNDTMLVLANGVSGCMIAPDAAGFAEFVEAFEFVCIELAKMIAADGEGASRLIEVEAQGLRTHADAVKVVKAVASSSLVKAAFFGKDANWGRIICAAGYSGAEYKPELVDVYLESAAGREQVMAEGAGLAFDEDNAARVLNEKTVRVFLEFHDGDEGAVAWGCDLTYDYVRINGEYRS